jgi:hypothetical protein
VGIVCANGTSREKGENQMFNSNPETGIPDTAGYPVTIPMDPNDWRLQALENMDLDQKAKAFDELIHKGTCDIELEARPRPVSDPQAINRRRSFMADALRRWGKTHADAAPVSSPMVNREHPSTPAGVKVPYESVVDADIPEGYPTPPIDLAACENGKACCQNRPVDRPPSELTRTAVDEVLRTVADNLPIDDLAKAVRSMAADRDGMQLFPARVIAQLAERVLATKA